MYVELFTDLVADSREIVGIFDLDNTTATSRYTADFLASKQREGKIHYFVSDIPKSFVLMSDGQVYLLEHSSRILKKRAEIW